MKQTKRKMHYKHTHTHTHMHAHMHALTSRNWVLILVRMEILWEEKGFQFGFKRWPGWAASCGSEFQMWGPKQEKVRKPWVLRLYCWISSMRVSEEERSVSEEERSVWDGV